MTAPTFLLIRTLRSEFRVALGTGPRKTEAVTRGMMLILLTLVPFQTWGQSLNWQSSNGFRVAPLAVPATGQAGFSRLAPDSTGVHFTNVLALSRHLTNQILLNGSGVAAGDVDGDGWCDLYFGGLDGQNGLYRNLGNWQFENITATAGVGCPGMDVTGVALVDFDGDGDLDIVLNSMGHGTHIFINQGRARFVRATPPQGLNPGRGGMSLAFGDIDGDGYLDFYIANYRVLGLMDMPETDFRLRTIGGKQVVAMVNGQPVNTPELAGRFSVTPKGGIAEHGEPDLLYRNLGGTNVFSLHFTQGAFLDENGQPLKTSLYDWGLSVMFRDLNGDRLPDIFVCNDFDSLDRVWINQGGGQFRPIAPLALRKTCIFSMGVDFADINRDGFDDFMVLDMLSRDHVERMDTSQDRNPHEAVIGRFDDRPEYMMNTLFLNRGDGTYAEIAQLSGVAASEWSWAVIFLDVDLDGWEDLLISNGHERRARSMDIGRQLRTQRIQQKLTPAQILQARSIYPRQASLNLAFRNRRDLTFEEVSQEWGFTTPTVSHGMALADLDNDGDLDLAVNNLHEAAGIYRNNTVAPRIAVRLKGSGPNTRGIGAKIILRGGDVAQSQEMMCGGRYLSSDEALRAFAASGPGPWSIEVSWPAGGVSLIEGALPNHVYEVFEQSATGRGTSGPGIEPATAFLDVSDRIRHVHHEDSYDDFARQPLLHRKLSQLGPGAAWVDLDDDGWEDLIVGTGGGGRLGVFRNDHQGGFVPLSGPAWDQIVAGDQTGIVSWSDQDGGSVVLVGGANYEEGRLSGAAVSGYRLGGKEPLPLVPRESGGAGPLALADVDGDGDLDLFVGGRVIPGRYPEAASSRLFRNEGGSFVKDAANSASLTSVGLVSGAVFSDLDGDGDVELVLACEWGGLRVFRNQEGKFSDITSELGLAEKTGWWNGVTTGDFDGDGDQDLAASNWGRNTPYEPYRGRPLELYYGDFDGNQVIDLVEAHYDVALRQTVPWRPLDFLAAGMPGMRERFPSYRAYGKASVEGVLATQFSAARRLEARWLESSVFINDGGKFRVEALPIEAQLSPAFGISAGDLDGDGAEDLLLSQNCFAVDAWTPRYDAGLGLWLKGDGRGGFSAVPGRESGIRVYGEQRGSALADFDRDGRLDVVVTQNGAETKLYRNVTARKGLRVRLRGGPWNPHGVGAVVRVGDGQKWGPAREIHAGSGYWSQDGAVQVLGQLGSVTHVWVRWPGREPATIKVPEGVREVSVWENHD